MFYPGFHITVGKHSFFCDNGGLIDQGIRMSKYTQKKRIKLNCIQIK